jgi:predicted regulator of Ras-like GTPase activity (Roadblock/LC7/MglB family)
MFCQVLPSDLQPYFEAIDPIAEIPIPLREIFLQLPLGLIKLREDQVIDRPAAAILTPFYIEAEEDAKRLDQSAPTPPEAGPAPAPLVSKNPFKADSERLNAIFMTDEILDLPKTIRKVGELPGLRACLLSTADGLKLAGNLDDQGLEQAISNLAPALFDQARAKLAGMRLGILETITLCFSQNQISTFFQGKFCLTVLHDSRPFKPGVREKIQTVMSEL